MRGRTGETLVIALALLGPLAGCTADEAGGRAEPAPSTSPSPSPVSASTVVDVVWWSQPRIGDQPLHVSYEATVSLGLPSADLGECGLTPPTGTGTVPVTVTLVNTDDGSREGVVHRSMPSDISAEPLGGAGPLRWLTTRPGESGCVDEPDLEQVFSGGWEYQETRELRAELVGVPLDDPSGSGVEVSFADADWEVVDGHADPVRIRF